MPKIHVEKISKYVYLLRLDDSETVYFESLWRIPEGITYNSYVITLPNTVVVLDTWKHRYQDTYIETLRQVVDTKDVKYIVVHHTEPDHSGSIKKLIENTRNPTILGHPVAGELLKSFYNIQAPFRPVRDGERLDLDHEHQLSFHHTPWLHWPDTMVSYLRPDRVLFSCDIFGSYGIPSGVFHEDLPEEERRAFRWYVQKYFVNVIGKYVDWVSKNLAKLSTLDQPPLIIAPGHGPLHRDVNYIIDLYKYLGSKPTTKGKIVMIYTSMYRFVEEAALIVSDELRRAGLDPRLYRFTDDHRDHESDLIGDTYDAESIILATSTYDADVFPLMKYLVELLKAKIPSGKKILVISDHGWGPVAGRKVREELESKGHFIVDVVEIKGLAKTHENKLRETTRKLVYGS